MRRVMSQKEREKRLFHAEVRKFKEWCTAHQVAYYAFKDAPPNSICAVSMDEYAVNTRRCKLDEDRESYFIHEDYYDEWEGEQALRFS